VPVHHAGRRHPGRRAAASRKAASIRMFRTGIPLGGGRLIGIYCRMPDGRVRVPPMDEMRRFCLRGQWQECPTYRRHAPAS